MCFDLEYCSTTNQIPVADCFFTSSLFKTSRSTLFLASSSEYIVSYFGYVSRWTSMAVSNERVKLEFPFRLAINESVLKAYQNILWKAHFTLASQTDREKPTSSNLLSVQSVYAERSCKSYMRLFTKIFFKSNFWRIRFSYRDFQIQKKKSLRWIKYVKYKVIKENLGYSFVLRCNTLVVQ